MTDGVVVARHQRGHVSQGVAVADDQLDGLLRDPPRPRHRLGVAGVHHHRFERGLGGRLQEFDLAGRRDLRIAQQRLEVPLDVLLVAAALVALQPERLDLVGEQAPVMGGRELEVGAPEQDEVAGGGLQVQVEVDHRIQHQAVQVHGDEDRPHVPERRPDGAFGALRFRHRRARGDGHGQGTAQAPCLSCRPGGPGDSGDGKDAADGSVGAMTNPSSTAARRPGRGQAIATAPRAPSLPAAGL